MTRLSKLIRLPKVWLKVCAAFLVLACAPLVFGPGGGNAVVQDACAKETGTCCYQEKSWCNAGGDDIENNYYKESGPCP